MNDSEEKGQICLLKLLSEGQISTCFWFLHTNITEQDNVSFKTGSAITVFTLD
jgi:hypothetical protein